MSKFNIILNLKSLKISKKILSNKKQLSGGFIGFDCVYHYLILLDLSAYKSHINEHSCGKYAL